MRELGLSIAQTSATRIYVLLISLLTLTLSARWLGPEGRGTLAAITTWVGLFSTFGYLSLGQVAIYQATMRSAEKWLSPMLGSLLLMTGLISVLGWGIALLLFISSGGAVFNSLSVPLLILGFLALPFMVWEQYGSALLMALDRISIYNNAQLIGRTTGIVLLVCLLAVNWGVQGMLMSILASQVIVSSAGIRFLFEHAGYDIVPNRSTIKSLLSGGLKLHLNAIGNFLILSTDVLIISYYHGATETGYYQMAVQLTGMLLIVPQAATMVLYGKITQLGPDGAWSYQRKILVWTIGLLLGLAIVSGLAAPWLIPLVMGAAFTPAVGAFQLLMLAIIGMSLATLMAPQWIGRGWFWQSAVLTMMFGLFNLVAALLWVPSYGMYGSIWGTLLTYACSIFVNGGVALWCERRFRRARLSTLILPPNALLRGVRD